MGFELLFFKRKCKKKYYEINLKLFLFNNNKIDKKNKIKCLTCSNFNLFTVNN